MIAPASVTGCYLLSRQLAHFPGQRVLNMRNHDLIYLKKNVNFIVEARKLINKRIKINVGLTFAEDKRNPSDCESMLQEPIAICWR